MATALASSVFTTENSTKPPSFATPGNIEISARRPTRLATPARNFLRKISSPKAVDDQPGQHAETGKSKFSGMDEEAAQDLLAVLDAAFMGAANLVFKGIPFAPVAAVLGFALAGGSRLVIR